jgi:hypothetical protein
MMNELVKRWRSKLTDEQLKTELILWLLEWNTCFATIN